MSKCRFTLAEIVGVIAAVVILVGLAVPFVRTARDAKNNSFGVALRRLAPSLHSYRTEGPEFDMFGDCEDPLPEGPFPEDLFPEYLIHYEAFGSDQEWE